MSHANAHRGGLAPTLYLNPDDLDSIVEYTSARARRLGSRRARTNHLIVHILAGSGLRASDICNLTLQDLPGFHKKPIIHVRDGKGNVSRTVQISDKLQDHIQAFIEEYRPDAKPTDPLIISKHGKPIAYRTIWLKIKALGKKLGIPGGLYPHKLRHSFAVKLYGRENDLLFVSQQLGHADVKTTQIYAKTTPQAARRQMEDF